MAFFTQGTMTAKGRALIAKAQAGECGIELTHAVAGSGIHKDTSTGALEKVTELIQPEREYAISDLATVDDRDTTAIITVSMHNRGLTKMFYLNELGIFAKDPDEGEILYCILVSENNLIYMPPDNEMGGFSAVTERIFIEVSNAAETTINTGGAVVGATDFTDLRKLVTEVVKGLRGGTEGQMLLKQSDALWDYGWTDISTVTRPYAEFPETGRSDAVYIDTDSSEIYVWKKLADENYGYFKLPLGAEASATLQKQITANADNIGKLLKVVAQLQAKHEETYVTVPLSGWKSANENGVTVYTNEIALGWMTAETNATLYPHIRSTAAADIIMEMKASGVFFGRGIADSAAGKMVLKTYGKSPKADFGICIVGKEVA